MRNLDTLLRRLKENGRTKRATFGSPWSTTLGTIDSQGIPRSTSKGVMKKLKSIVAHVATYVLSLSFRHATHIDIYTYFSGYGDGSISHSGRPAVIATINCVEESNSLSSVFVLGLFLCNLMCTVGEIKI